MSINKNRQAGLRFGPLTASRAALLLTTLAGLAVVADLPGILRVPVVLMFCLVAPGLGIIPNLKLGRPTMEGTLVVGVSIATLILGSTLLVKVGLWSVGWMLLAVALPTLIGCGIAELRSQPSTD
jgi:hypothetical protein